VGERGEGKGRETLRSASGGEPAFHVDGTKKQGGPTKHRADSTEEVREIKRGVSGGSQKG